MMTSMRSPSSFHQALAYVLAPLFTAGCGIDEDQFTDDVCSNEGYDMVGAIEPAMAVDYLELRSVSAYAEDPQAPAPSVLDSVGERCSGASDRPACETAFAALPAATSELRVFAGYEGDDRWSLAFTRDDEATVILQRGPLLEFLGEIDAPGDAALLASVSGHQLYCTNGNDVGPHEDGFVLYTTSGSGCGQGDHVERHVVLVHANGAIESIQTERVERADPNCAIGRLPAGPCRLLRVVPRSASPVGAFLAEVAQLEAAAVTAFGQLAQELALHRAPRSLVRAAWRSRGEEVTHAHMMAGLARRHGGRPIAPRPAAWAPRGLVDVAADNAAEGCVRETYGALVAHVQARRASDPIARRMLGRIARDETRHAALSWSLAQWARARMSAAERRRVTRSAQHALERLALEVLQPCAPAVERALGMPRPDEARALYRRMRDVCFA
jgi:hypothetical protein